jgi:riboflavin synthase alpha subunit
MDIKDKSFIVHLTEYTQKLTTLGEVYPGYKANIEIDIFSKYLIK